jgi:adenylate cyclase
MALGPQIEAMRPSGREMCPNLPRAPAREPRAGFAWQLRGRQTVPMEPSPELANVLARLLEAIRDGDEQAVSNRFSRQLGFERYGSDPAEHWRDGEEAVLVLIQQIRETGGFPWQQVGDIHAMSEGSVGWASGEMEFEGALGMVPYRVSCVLHLEHGEWKIVQWLSAVPATNESYGFLLTTSVDDIAVSVQAARPDLSGTMSADGTVTIAFTDIEDSTKLNGLLGDDRWLAVLHAHNGVIGSVTAEFDGTVVKNQGDGFMLAFPSSRRGLACALAIQKTIGEQFNDPGSPIRVRIGLHVGETIREADDFFGHAVAYAARIASSAAGGETVVSSLVHDLIGMTGGYRFGEPRTVELKGIEDSQIVYPVLDHQGG